MMPSWSFFQLTLEGKNWSSKRIALSYEPRLDLKGPF